MHYGNPQYAPPYSEVVPYSQQVRVLLLVFITNNILTTSIVGAAKEGRGPSLPVRYREGNIRTACLASSLCQLRIACTLLRWLMAPVRELLCKKNHLPWKKFFAARVSSLTKGCRTTISKFCGVSLRVERAFSMLLAGGLHQNVSHDTAKKLRQSEFDSGSSKPSHSL